MKKMRHDHLATAAALNLLVGAALTATVLLYERVNRGFDPVKGDFKTLVGLSSPQIVASCWLAIAYFVQKRPSRRLWPQLSAVVILAIVFACSFLPALLIFLQGKSKFHILFPDFALIFGGTQSVLVAFLSYIGKHLFGTCVPKDEPGAGAA
jgi:hypothetical protein